MNTNTAINNFHKFLVNSYEILKSIEGHEMFEEIQNDFYQANWELLVESIICTSGKEYLLEYGQGADCNPQSSRVSFPDKQANTQIICKKSNQNVEIKDIISGNPIETENYYFNSFINIHEFSPKNDDIYRYIKLEHNIFDEHVIIEFTNIIFCKKNMTPII